MGAKFLTNQEIPTSLATEEKFDNWKEFVRNESDQGNQNSFPKISTYHQAGLVKHLSGNRSTININNNDQKQLAAAWGYPAQLQTIS